MRSTTTKQRQIGHRLVHTAVALLLATVCLSSCGASDDESSSSSTGLTTVTLALDYLPGPVHNGLAYAMQNGLFESEGIQVKLIPYNNTTAETLVAAGKADVGYSADMGSAITSFATEAPVKSIFMIEPHEPYALSVLASSGIERPADLAGTIYGGFGSPLEEAVINTMIEDDGGTGAVKQVVLSVGANEALRAGEVDSTITYPEQEYELQRDGIETNRFAYFDHGVPMSSGPNVVANSDWLEKDSDLARGFVRAMQKGYQTAIDDPDAANAALLKQFPDLDPDVVTFVADLQATELFVNDDGAVGTQVADRWAAYAEWMCSQDLLVDADGKALAEFDPTSFVTNEYLPS